MLIHSVTPVHLLIPETQLPACSYKQVGGGYLEGTQTAEGFRLSRIHSTDPAMYLNKDYSPGSIYRGEAR